MAPTGGGGDVVGRRGAVPQKWGVRGAGVGGGGVTGATGTTNDYVPRPAGEDP